MYHACFVKFLLKWENQCLKQFNAIHYSVNLLVAVAARCISRIQEKGIWIMCMKQWEEKTYQLWFLNLSFKTWYYCLCSLAETNIRFILNNTCDCYDLFFLLPLHQNIYYFWSEDWEDLHKNIICRTNYHNRFFGFFFFEISLVSWI